MEFLYVFSIMFLLIFGLTVLVKLIAWAVLTRCSVKHDVFVRSGEDLDGFVASVRRDPHVRRVVILSAGERMGRGRSTACRKVRQRQLLQHNGAVIRFWIGNRQ